MHQVSRMEPITESKPMIDRGRCLSSQDLLQGGQQVLIEHEREVYVLRVTRQGKLILTK